MGINLSKNQFLLTVGAGGAATLFIYALLKSDSPHQARERPTSPSSAILGLANRGNICFLNAVLQAVASCRYILEWLRYQDRVCNYDLEQPVKTMDTYRKVQYPLTATMLRSILVMNRDIMVEDYRFAGKIPRDILRALIMHGHRIATQEEQDASEFFLLLMGELNREIEASIHRRQVGSVSALIDGRVLEEPSLDLPLGEENVRPVEMNPEAGDWALIDSEDSFRVNERIYSKRSTELEDRLTYKSAPNLPLRTLMLTQMQCICCLTKSHPRLECSEVWTLNLPPYNPARGVALYDLILRFMKPVLVHNVDCNTCTQKRLGGVAPLPGTVKDKTTYFKHNFVCKLPYTLCIMIPRVTWGARGMEKRLDFVAFPDRINLGMLKRFYTGEMQEEDYNTQRVFKQQPDAEISLRRFRNSEYTLVAVVSHVGDTHDTGHYVTFRRHPHKERPLKEHSTMWYHVSDEKVEQVPIEYVLGTRAYMLFYEKTYAN